MKTATQLLRETFEWYRNLPQSEKDKITAESKAIAAEAHARAQGLIRQMDRALGAPTHYSLLATRY